MQGIGSSVINYLKKPIGVEVRHAQGHPVVVVGA